MEKVILVGTIVLCGVLWMGGGSESARITGSKAQPSSGIPRAQQSAQQSRHAAVAKLRQRSRLSHLVSTVRRRAGLVTKAGAAAPPGATLHPTSVQQPYAGGPSLWTTRTSTTTVTIPTVNTPTTPTTTSTKTTTSTTSTSTTTSTTTSTSTSTSTCPCSLMIYDQCTMPSPCNACCGTGLSCVPSASFQSCSGLSFPFCCLNV